MGEKRNFERVLTKQATLVATGIIRNGNLLGRIGFITLVVFENAFIAFIIIVNSQPTYNLAP